MHFVFYSYKGHQKESIEFSPTATGWMMSNQCYQGPIEPNGMPHLQRCIAENYAEVPPALGDAFQEIWKAETMDKLEDGALQECLNTFSKWVDTFNVYKHASPIYLLN